jgi:hypothetical protein
MPCRIEPGVGVPGADAFADLRATILDPPDNSPFAILFDQAPEQG